jgi:hypothetical protein
MGLGVALTRAYDTRASAKILERLAPGFENGALKPAPIARRFSLDEAGEAYRAVDSGSLQGKAVVVFCSVRPRQRNQSAKGVAMVLASLTIGGRRSPWLLLALTFALSAGNAFEMPTWRALLPELVAKDDVGIAIATRR